jgi:putative DNA primase/helicase
MNEEPQNHEHQKPLGGDNDNSIKKGVLGGALPALATPLSKEELLKCIMERVVAINFRELAGVVVEARVTPKMYKVLVIRGLLEIARKLGYNLCKKNGVCYVFNGAFWIMMEVEQLQPYLGAVAEKMGVPYITAHDADFRRQLYEQFLSAAYLNAMEPDTSKILINLQNGTFEFMPEQFELRGFRQTDFMTYQLPFGYDPEAKAPRFEAYLNRVLPDKECQQQLKEYSGYLFTKGLKLEQVLMLYGEGANGKSVFFDILTGMLGSENCCSYSLNRLADTNQGYSRAMLGNKLVNYATEVSGNIDSGIFKQLASGEPIEARFPYGKPFMLTKYAKLIFNVNELPKNVEHTKGFFRRFLVIPFTVTIPDEERDVDLAAKIIASELPGVFNWILEGLRSIVAQRRFTESEASKSALKEYETESDSVALFIEEKRYQVSVAETVALGALFKEYQEFCKIDGYRPVSKRMFVKRLKHQKVQLARRNTGMVVFLEKIPATPDPEPSAGGE